MAPPVDLDALLALCAGAAEVVRREYRGAAAQQFRAKEDDSPLTRADLASHAHLSTGLLALTPDIPVLSEESEPQTVAGRHQWRRLWLVDPLDGTRDFLERSGEFSINLALIEDGRPGLGLVFEPLAQTACLGVAGVGAWHCRLRQGRWLREPLGVTSRDANGPVRVLASPRHHDAQIQGFLQLLAGRAGGVARRNVGSALKFAMLARGEADCYPRFAPCSEWDVAAGHGVLRALGGDVLSLDGAPLRYNQCDSLRSPHFLAVADRADRLWGELLAVLPGPTDIDGR
jgi:3'(2'), 5'-bisphosphate nucleotidase